MAEELKVENVKAKKKPVSVKTVIVKVIIVILALLMVGSAYYIVILLTADKTEEKSAYGSYDKEPVLIEYNNVFYNSLMNDSSFQEAYQTGNYTNLWSSYYSAYQAQVVYIALSKMAKEAGISAPQELVNRAIIESGVFNGEDGKFSEEVYSSTDPQIRSNTESYMRSIYPYQTVLSDMYTSVITAKEKEFVKNIANDARDLEYFVIDYNAYPDDLAEDFGKANSDLFKSAELTMISFASKDAAAEAATLLASGTQAEDIEGASVTSGKYSVNTIQESLSEKADIDKIVALSVDSYSEPVMTTVAYTIFKLDSAFVKADYTDDAVLSEVKQYIYKTDADSVKSYIEADKESAAKIAVDDFDSAASLFGNGVLTVSGVGENVGGSQFVTGVSSVDSTGLLASAVKDSTVSKEIFTATKGAICGPIAVDGGYVMVKVADTEAASLMGSLIESVYDYYANQLPTNDLTNAILTSDKLKDNFTSQFLSMMMGNLNVAGEN